MIDLRVPAEPDDEARPGAATLSAAAMRRDKIDRTRLGQGPLVSSSLFRVSAFSTICLSTGSERSFKLDANISGWVASASRFGRVGRATARQPLSESTREGLRCNA
jgi:hypothetical protein